MSERRARSGMCAQLARGPVPLSCSISRVTAGVTGSSARACRVGSGRLNTPERSAGRGGVSKLARSLAAYDGSLLGGGFVGMVEGKTPRFRWRSD